MAVPVLPFHPLASTSKPSRSSVSRLCGGSIRRSSASFSRCILRRKRSRGAPQRGLLAARNSSFDTLVSTIGELCCASTSNRRPPPRAARSSAPTASPPAGSASSVEPAARVEGDLGNRRQRIAVTGGHLEDRCVLVCQSPPGGRCGHTVAGPPPAPRSATERTPAARRRPERGPPAREPPVQAKRRGRLARQLVPRLGELREPSRVCDPLCVHLAAADPSVSTSTVGWINAGRDLPQMRVASTRGNHLRSGIPGFCRYQRNGIVCVRPKV